MATYKHAVILQVSFSFAFCFQISFILGVSIVQGESGENAILSSHMERRTDLLWKEAKRAVGFSLALNEKEKKVDEILLAAKKKEVEEGFEGCFPPAVNFLVGKPLVERSRVFDIIRRMPKGR